MKQTSTKLWRGVSIAAVLSTLLMLTGFAYAVKDMLWPQASSYSGDLSSTTTEEQGRLATSDTIRVTAIGDSLTKGTGDATGEGYVKQVIAMLSDKLDKKVQLTNNLAINGMRADRLAELLKGDKGYHYALSQSDLILFTIGGNDLFQLAAGTNASSAAGVVDLAQLKERLADGLKRFETVTQELAEINPDAKIVYVGLYNPFYDLQELREGSLTIQQWNEQAYAMVHRYPNMMMVPTFDLFEATISDYLSSDHFHPNHEGYAQIAARIVQALH
ncbi:GDSL-type esterase/lipase family protein [Paenibacillus sp. GCM10027626]|uniref:GDSL-type esterase/lipase family protein n=1 Tax=Paenibacillus sp. GCM10027626 TaxID=3273411 RepID=UPI003630BBE6